VYNLMRKNDAVRDLPSFHVACLFFGDDMSQYRFQPVGYNLCDDFVNHIAEGNGSEVLWMSDSLFLGNEGEEGCI
jgi:hypothetical protein